MTLVAGVDFETSGLDPVRDRIVEIGAVLWDWENQIPLSLMSDLVYHDDLIMPAEVVAVHGITDAMLRDLGRLEEGCITDLNAIICRSEYIFAHFGSEFDRHFYNATIVRLELPRNEPSPRLWVDTAIDIVYPERITTRNLRHLAAEHGFLNPFSHRAVFDVLTMLRIAGMYDLEKMVARSQEPMVYLMALVSFNDKDKAKERSYRWHPPTKTWWKGLKASDVIKERSEAPFDTSILQWTGAPRE